MVCLENKRWRGVTLTLMVSAITVIYFIHFFSSERILYRSWLTAVQTSNRAPCGNVNMTIISAFFDIGDHEKGDVHRQMTEYYAWAKAWGYIHTPLVFYTDSRNFSSHMTNIRSRLPAELTHVIHIQRGSLWPWNLSDFIARLYSTDGYPKFYPNTVLPEYTCVQHSKYACLLDAILTRHTASKHYAWVDLGYFWDLEEDSCLTLPPKFSPGKVSYNQVYLPNFRQKPHSIFYNNQVWVGGGMFVAARDTMVTMCKEYQRAAEYFLFKQNLSSTDQQVLYASFTKEGRREVNLSVKVNVQAGPHGWFDLGHSCLHKVNNTRTPE